LIHVTNIHKRRLAATTAEVGALLDTLASPGDRLWPKDDWPPMRLRPGLEVGAEGGHGPVRYAVSAYQPGRRVELRFDPDGGVLRGFRGRHVFEVEASGDQALLRHTIDAECTFPAWIRWALAIRWLHDALLEDALDRAAAELGGELGGERPARRAWSPWVRLLRRLAARGRGVDPSR
jgi:hypothetical protein